MIWKSVALMTVVDLLIISVVAYSLWVFLVYRRLLAEAKPRVGLTAVVAGLLLVGAFYAADLAVMHVMPLFLARGVTMGIMTDLHLEYQWTVTLIGVGAIAFGSAVMTRQMFDMVGRLRRSEEQFRAVVNHSPTKIHIKDVEGRYTLINREAEKLFGVTDEEGWGKTSYEIFPKQLADSFADHDREVLETGRSIEVEEEWVQEDGVHTYFTVKFPIPGATGEIVGVGAIGTDITERKRMEKALRESEERFRAIFSHVFDAIITIGSHGIVEAFNPAAERLFGYDVAEVVGKNISMLMTEADRSEHDGYLKRYHETGKGPVVCFGREVEGKRKDGSVFLADLAVTVMEVGGQITFIGTLRDITERKRAEEALRASEERLQRCVLDAPIPIMIHAEDGEVLMISQQWTELTGYTHAEIPTILDWTKKAYGVDKDHMRGLIGGLYEIEEPFEDEVFVTTIWGKQRTWDFRSSPLGRLPDGRRLVISMAMDITERKRAEEALRASEQRFKHVVEAASDWFWEMDEKLRFTFFSDRRQQLTGLAPEDNIGKTRWEVAGADPDNDEKWRQHRRVILEAHEPFRDFEYAFTTKDGKTKYNRISGKPVFDANGAFKGYRGAATDVTEKIEAHVQLLQAAKLATLGEMASGIAHELNQPLSVVGMAAENSLISMEEGTFDTEFVRKKLETIVGQKERMAGIINHMRLFSRRDATAMERFNPVACVAGAVGLVKQQFRASGIEVKTDFPAACRNVFGHPVQLEQVVLNLLNNARDAILGGMKSAGSGKGRPAPRVRVSVVDDKRRKAVVISVADTGGGIPEQALGRIFDPFFTTKKKAQGTGLGLSISYSIIDAMGGRLEAQNAYGGAEFRISVPAAVDGSGAVDRRSRKKKRKARTTKRRSGLPRVLVVDDEELIAEELAEYLQLKGYDVATAGSGLEALELHRSRPADIVITDLLMPEMDGNELIRRLRRTDPDLPIMLVTGHTTFGDEKESVGEGASVVLKKPIDLSELLGTLGNMVHL